MYEMSDEEVLANDTLTKKQKCEILIKNNIGLLKKEAGRFKKSRTNVVCDEEDYQQEACFAIFNNVIDNFDPSKGIKFSTYLTHCVRNAIKKEASRFHGPLTITNHIRLLMTKVNYLKNKGYHDEDIKAVLKLKDKIYSNIIFLSKISRIEEGIEEQVIELNSDLIVEEAGLTDQEKRVVELRQNRTLREVGKILNCSAEWVRKIEKSAIDKVKAIL